MVFTQIERRPSKPNVKSENEIYFTPNYCRAKSAVETLIIPVIYADKLGSP